jgi:uncharacterized protein YkwD
MTVTTNSRCGHTTVWRSLAIAAIAGAILACAALAAPRAGAWTPGAAVAGTCPGADVFPTAKDFALARSSMVCLMNRDRTARGLRRLAVRPTLNVAAARHSRDMVRRQYFAHESPTGGTLLSRVRAAGYLRGARSYTLGENIAWGTGYLATPARIHQSLMNSPGHRANILRGAFRNVGVGLASGVPERTIDFGTRR